MSDEKKKPKLKESKSTPELKQTDSVEEKLKKLEAEITNLPSPVEATRQVAKPNPADIAQPEKAKAKSTLIPFIVLLILSLTLCNMPGFNLLFAPINQFVVMIHEMSHALMAILTGGHVTSLTIVPDGAGHGGITQRSGGWPLLIAPAGYLGTTLFGCLLIALGQYPRASRYVLVGVGVFMAIASLALIGGNILASGLAGFASLLWGLALSAALIWTGAKLKGSLSHWFLLFLAIQTALNSITSLQTLLLVTWTGGTAQPWSDATNMQAMTLIPAPVWSFLWALISLVMVAMTLWFTYGRRIVHGDQPKKIAERKRGA